MLALTVGVLGELERVQRALCPGLRVRLADAVEPSLQHQFLAGRRVVPRAAALCHVADASTHLAGLAAQVGTGDGGVAAVRLDEGREHAQSGRLAGAVRPKKAEDLALGDPQVDSLDRVDRLLLSTGARSERLAQPLGLDDHDCPLR